MLKIGVPSEMFWFSAIFRWIYKIIKKNAEEFLIFTYVKKNKFNEKYNHIKNYLNSPISMLKIIPNILLQPSKSFGLKRD